MKKWIAAGILVALLFAATLILLGSYFVWDLAMVFTQNQPTDASITESEEIAEESADESTVETTIETVDETTVETTVEETTVEETTTEETTVETTTVQTTTEKPTEKPTQENVAKPEPKPGIDNLSAKYAFVFDIASNTYLFAKGNDRDIIPPASLTKLFSAYVALQYLEPDTVVTAGEEVRRIDPQSSRAWIEPGHKLTVQQCVQGMMMPSGNDAAYVLAVAAGRAIKNDGELNHIEAYDAFIAEMNNKAMQCGLTGTQFKNPDGMGAEGHYTTLYDLIIISKLAMSQPVILKYASTYQEAVTFVSGETITWRNSNWLLNPNSSYYCPEAVGLKTGSHSEAGNCLISLFKKGDSYLLIGVMGCPSEAGRFDDTLALYKNFNKNP